MRLSDLRDKVVRSLDGKKLGRVHDVHCDGARVTALMCGPGSLIERWTGQNKGHRVPWETVRRMDSHAVIVSDAGAKRKV
jgi:sporulation protein YlmC with PRC-barrel domain